MDLVRILIDGLIEEGKVSIEGRKRETSNFISRVSVKDLVKALRFVKRFQFLGF